MFVLRLVGFGLATVAVAGSLFWDATWAVPFLARQMQEGTGCSLQARRLEVALWRGFEARDVFVQWKGGGRLHLRRVVGRFVWPAAGWDGLPVRFRVHDIHVDPGSWRIHSKKAAALLAASPVMKQLIVWARFGSERITLERMQGWGKWLRWKGTVRGLSGRQVQGEIRGQVATDLLRAFGLHHVRGVLEPFRLSVRSRGSRLSWAVCTSAYQWRMTGGEARHGSL